MGSADEGNGTFALSGGERFAQEFGVGRPLGQVNIPYAVAMILGLGRWVGGRHGVIIAADEAGHLLVFPGVVRGPGHSGDVAAGGDQGECLEPKLDVRLHREEHLGPFTSHGPQKSAVQFREVAMF